jgi:tetratricopeptide (TPR) repeat protein
MRIKLSILICLLLPFSAWSQKEKINTKEGNEDYASGRYEEAIQDYTEALENDPEYMEALFNTGNALQQMSRRLQEQAQNAGSEEEKKKLMEGAKTASDKAASQFASVAKMAKTNEEINKAQYNLGNSRLMSGELEASIEAYKEALRKVPGDDDARYNLAYAQHLKKQQEQQQQQQQQQQDQKQDQQQDQEKQEQEQNQDQQNQEQQKQQEQQQPQQLSKEEAEQLLQALMKQEKDLQEDLKKKKKQKAQRVKIEKDW